MYPASDRPAWESNPAVDQGSGFLVRRVQRFESEVAGFDALSVHRLAVGQRMGVFSTKDRAVEVARALLDRGPAVTTELDGVRITHGMQIVEARGDRIGPVVLALYAAGV